MTKINRRRLLVLGVLAALVLPTEALVILTVRSQHQSLENLWSFRMSHATRLRAVERLQDYPVAYRHALLRQLPESNRIAAWQAVAQSYIVSRRDLTQEQVQLIAQAIAAQAEARPLPWNPGRDRLTEISEKVRASLGDDAYRVLFVDAGPPDAGPAYRYSSLSVRTRLEAFLRSRVLAASANCACRLGMSSDCDKGYNCQYDSTCTQTSTGCGIDREQPCDGTCKKNPDDG